MVAGGWNQLVKNGNFADGSSNWSTGGYVTITGASNNILTVSTPGGGGNIIQTIAHATNHKYYCCATVNPTVQISAGVRIYGSPQKLSTKIVRCSANTWTKIHDIFYYDSLTNTTQSFYIYPDYDDTATAFTEQIKDVMCIDLTLLFGEGNEPYTAEEFEEYFSLDKYYKYHQPENNLSDLNYTVVSTF